MDRAPRLERTALVVDDDVFVLSALAELLSEEGYDVHTATNGFSALRIATEFRPGVILLDLVMPERGGGDVLSEIRAAPATRDGAVVVVTGNAHLLTESQVAQTDGVVAKPFDVNDLLATIKRALQHAASRRSEVRRIAEISHRDATARQFRATAVRRTRPRR